MPFCTVTVHLLEIVFSEDVVVPSCTTKDLNVDLLNCKYFRGNSKKVNKTV